MKSILFVALTCFAIASRGQNQDPTLSITAPANGLAGTTISLSLDKGGSTGSVTWSVTSRGGTASIVSNNQLLLTTVGAVELKADVAADATYNAASVSKIITINASDLSNPLMAQIWGTTVDGGPANGGVLFRMNADGTGYTVMDQLMTDPGGASPFYNRPMVASDGKVYYTLIAGGKYAAGVLVRFDPSDNSFTALYHFKMATGGSPSSELIEAPNGLLYGITNNGGENGNGAVFSYELSTGTYTLLHSFDYSTTGANPNGAPCMGPDGNLYGLSLIGGANGSGVLYMYDPVAKTTTVKKALDVTTGTNPYGTLRVASNNKIYGVTTYGGANAGGTVFEFDPATSAFTVKVPLTSDDLYNCVAGFSRESNDHLFYAVGTYSGLGYGTLVSYSPGATTITKLFDFGSGVSDVGRYPFGAVTIASTGKLYALTSSASPSDYTCTLFEYDPSNGEHSDVHKFTFDEGAFGSCGVAETADGMLYGMTTTGGAGESGTFFSYKPSTGDFIKLRDFTFAPGGVNPRGAVQYTDHKIIYTADGGSPTPKGVLLEFNTTTNVSTQDIKYMSDTARLTRGQGFTKHSNGKFYSTTLQGYAVNNGSITEYNPATGELRVLKSFPGYPTLVPSDAGLIEMADHKLYSVGNYGANMKGAIYSFDLATNEIQVVYSFGVDEGTGPQGITLGPDNMLFGISRGGVNNAGIIYKFNLATTTFTKLYDLEGPAGAMPMRNMTLASNGKFYGFALQGANGSTILFELDPANGTFTKKLNFGDSLDYTSLAKGVNGKLLGSTIHGGEHNFGYIFEYDPATNVATPKTDFSDDTGYHPNSLWVLVKRDQTITFEAAAKTLGDAPSTLGGSSTSQLPLTYSSTSDKISISGSQVTLLKPGRASVKADQPGSDNFNAAPGVETSFCINPAKATITAGAVTDAGVTLTSSADAGNQWYKGDVKIDGATAKTYTATVVGDYTVQVKADDCLSVISDKKTLTVVTGLTDDLTSNIKIYPNPATSELFIEIPSSGSDAQVKLLDLLGRIIETREIRSNSLERFELAHLKPSMYIVRIAHDGKMMSRVFVKQ